MTFRLHSSVFGREGGWICLKLLAPPQCRATTQGDLFIWLLPSKLACPLDRWPLCPSSRRAVSLPGTKQLEGQLCGDPSYSLSLFLPAFTLSLSPCPTSFYQFLPLVYLLANTPISPTLPIFLHFFFFAPAVDLLMQIWQVTFTNIISITGVRLCALCASASAALWRWKKSPPSVLPEPVPRWATSPLSHLISRTLRRDSRSSSLSPARPRMRGAPLCTELRVKTHSCSRFEKNKRVCTDKEK